MLTSAYPVPGIGGVHTPPAQACVPLGPAPALAPGTAAVAPPGPAPAPPPGTLAVAPPGPAPAPVSAPGTPAVAPPSPAPAVGAPDSVPDGAGAIVDSDGAVVMVVVVSVLVLVDSEVLLESEPLPLSPQATVSVPTANAAAMPVATRKRTDLRSEIMCGLDSV